MSAGSPSGDGIRLPARTGGPRRVARGLRLDGRRGEPVAPAAMTWLRGVQHAVDPTELEEGRRYARLGQIISIRIEPGLVVAMVQGAAPQPYRVRLEVETIAPANWDELIVAMGEEARLAASLAMNEIAPGLLELLGAHAAWLGADGRRAFVARCTCRRERGCRHAVAASMLVAERLEDDPTLLLTLLGVRREEVQQRLRSARATQASGGAARLWTIPLGSPPATTEPADPDSFWGHPYDIAAARAHGLSEHPPQALLRRLGPSPFDGRFPLVGLLASVYEHVRAATIEARDRAEDLPEEPDQSSEAAAFGVAGPDCSGTSD